LYKAKLLLQGNSLRMAVGGRFKEDLSLWGVGLALSISKLTLDFRLLKNTDDLREESYLRD
jgi:hypothetical protein